jgi:amino acid adenylation domain-containing protein
MRVELHPANVFHAEPRWAELTVAELFSRQAQLTPETPAIVFREHLLTYARVEEQSNQLAHFLQQRGVGPEIVVALCLERGVDALEHLIALLAVWKASGAYLMGDPAYYPEEQIRSMLGNERVRLILTQQRLQARLPETPLASVVSLDAAQEEIRVYPTTAPLSRATPETLAYVIYTSGSTGQPKGVLVEHRWLPYLAHEQIQLFQVQPGDRFSHLLAPSFDASLSEILTAWLAGATLYPAPLDALRPGPRMVAYLAQHHINLAHFTPSVLTALPDADLPALRTLVVGGEVCPAELAMRHTRLGRQVILVYGLTETTVCNFGYRYPDDGSQPSLGRAFSYVQVEVWDKQGQPVAEGEPGQLVLAEPLARGYTDEAQTTARFIARSGQRWCLTGDYGYAQADGTYRFLGRQDAQQKVAGYLLNLAAVEAALREHPDMRDARAFLYGGRWVIAYVVLHRPGILRMSELRAFLLARLPGRAVPACCIPLDALPLSAHGKASSRLEDYPTPTAQDYQRFEEVFHAPETEAERTLAAMIQRQIENPLVAHDPQAVNILKSLPELGVDSLGMVGVELDIAEQFRVSHLTEEQLTTWPLYKLASFLAEQLSARSDQP